MLPFGHLLPEMTLYKQVTIRYVGVSRGLKAVIESWKSLHLD